MVLGSVVFVVVVFFPALFDRAVLCAKKSKWMEGDGMDGWAVG